MDSVKRLIRPVVAPLSVVSSAAVLYVAGAPAAEIFVQSVGIEFKDLVTTYLVRFLYVLGCLILLSVSLKPFYWIIDRLTDYDTDEELRMANAAVGLKIGLCFAGFLIAAGLIMAAGISP